MTIVNVSLNLSCIKVLWEKPWSELIGKWFLEKRKATHWVILPVAGIKGLNSCYASAMISLLCYNESHNRRILFAQLSLEASRIMILLYETIIHLFQSFWLSHNIYEEELNLSIQIRFTWNAWVRANLP